MIKLQTIFRLLMNIKNPVAQLDEIFIDDLGQDWDLSGCPEEVILGVPRGTVGFLLRQINKKKLWPSLYAVATQHSEQWMLDLSDFFPHEEDFVEPLVSFLLMSKGEHARVCFAVEADEWAWGPNTMHLLPIVIERVRQIRDEIDKDSIPAVVIPRLDHVIKYLSDSERSMRSDCS